MPDKRMTSQQSRIVQLQMQEQAQLCVLAPPGSGKTFALVESVKAMIQAGIRPDQILVLTYNKSAALEIAQRLEQELPSGEDGAIDMPKVSTQHALGYEILRENRRVLGYLPVLLTDTEQKKVLEEVCASLPPIGGISYADILGPYGMLLNVSRRIDHMKKLGRQAYEAVLESDGIDIPSFFAVADRFEEICTQKGYITFEEQITLCNKLFRDVPDLKLDYRSLYRYVYVDEYQDITEATAELIWHLTGRFGHLFVIGDDDQEINSFRGSDNRFLRNFRERYPYAKTMYLTQNFRSSRQVVSFAQTLIRHDRSPGRQEKRMDSEIPGNPPVYLEHAGVKELKEQIDAWIAGGYHYQDIAILATTNAELDRLRQDDSLKHEVPMLLAKAYVRTDPVFLILLSIFRLYTRGLDDNGAFYRLLAIFREEVALDLEPKGGSLYQAALGDRPDITDTGYWSKLEIGSDYLLGTLALLSDAFAIFQTGCTSITAMREILHLLDLDRHVVVDHLEEQAKDDPRLLELPAMAEYIEDLYDYADQTRLHTRKADAVTLSTCHDAKGQEWPCVIIWNMQSFGVSGDGRKPEEALTELIEKRRLLYVAATRAQKELTMFSCGKDRLYNLTQEIKKALEEARKKNKEEEEDDRTEDLSDGRREGW